MADRSLLYLTQIQPQNANPWDEIDQHKAIMLRSYFVLQAMFFDRLVIGDSQLINVAYLRGLIWPGEMGGRFTGSDFSKLLEQGVLVAAVRSSAPSLYDIWNDLVQRGVSYAGSEEYVRFLESHIGRRKQISYEASRVSALFREQVLATLSPGNMQLRLKAPVRCMAYDYVLSQDVLYHITMRKWMEQQVARGRMTAHHKAVLEDVLLASYMFNVPKSIAGSLIDVPLDPRKFWTPIDIHLGRRSVVTGEGRREHASFQMRPFSVSPRVLGALPAETLLAIRADQTRRKALRSLAHFRRTGEVDSAGLAGDIEAFLSRAEEIAYADVRGELRESIKEARRTRRVTRLTVARDLGLAVAGVSIWGAAGEVANQIANATGYLGLVVTAWASIDTLRNFGSAYRRGYAVGRAIPDEHRLILAKPSTMDEGT
jgi:hypothetical protein